VLESNAWPLIGRAGELDLIAGAIKKSSCGAGVAITGALGVGKSRLAQAAVARCEHAVVHWTAGSAAARSIPLGAFMNWLPADVHDPVQATGRVIAELLAGARPCVVGVDDAHLLDDTSAFLLQQLVDRRLAKVVLTVCTGVAVSDVVAALWRDGRLERIDLQPLGHADCVKLLETVLDGPMDPVSERRLWHLTRGNVRYMRHIVDQEFNAGRLRFNDGTWTWMPGLVVPSPVCDLIEQQMGDLPEAVAEAVDLLSVAEPLTSRMLAEIVGTGPMEEAEKRSLIIVEGRDVPVVRLAHPLYGEVRRARAGPIRLDDSAGQWHRGWRHRITLGRFCGAARWFWTPTSPRQPRTCCAPPKRRCGGATAGWRCGSRKRQGRQAAAGERLLPAPKLSPWPFS
jgi:hypothetical protein